MDVNWDFFAGALYGMGMMICLIRLARWWKRHPDDNPNPLRLLWKRDP